MERISTTGARALVVLAVLAVMAAFHWLKIILVPVAFALLLTCVLAPVTRQIRRVLPVGPTGAALLLFVILATAGLYLATITAESLVQAANALPGELASLSNRLNDRLERAVGEQPFLKKILPEPETVSQLIYQNRLDLIARFRDGLVDRLGELTKVVAQGLIILVLVLFLLAESDVLIPKLIRFFTTGPGDARAAEETFQALTREIRAFLLARTLLNLGMGVVVTLVLWGLGVRFPMALGVFAALTNYVPYVGQVIGGALPVLVTMVHSESIGDALIVAAAYLAVVTIAEYLVAPVVLGRSLDLNGTTVLIACLFWGFLWGLVGLILAIPLTVSLKLVFQHIPSQHRWAELMSRDWHPPRELEDEDTTPRSKPASDSALRPVEHSSVDPASAA